MTGFSWFQVIQLLFTFPFFVPRGTPWLLEGGADVLIWGRQNYLGSEISKSQMCKMCLKFGARRDCLGSDISSMSLSKPFFNIKFVFETG